MFTLKKRSQSSPVAVNAYIKNIELDSISRTDLFNEHYFQFTQKGIKITQGVIYFYGGESFKNVQQKTFAGDYLNFLGLYSIINAKPPYKLTLYDFNYINQKVKREGEQELH